MNRIWLVAVAVAALGGCAADPQPAAPASPAVAAAPAPAQVPPAASGGDNHGGGRRGGGAASVPRTIPADFPADVPLPAGSVQGSTGSAGRWSVLLAETGRADEVQRSTIAFYTAAGFAAESDQIVHRGAYRITVFAENRDHTNPSNASLTINVVQT